MGPLFIWNSATRTWRVAQVYDAGVRIEALTKAVIEDLRRRRRLSEHATPSTVGDQPSTRAG